MADARIIQTENMKRSEGKEGVTAVRCRRLARRRVRPGLRYRRVRQPALLDRKARPAPRDRWDRRVLLVLVD